ncbi:MAG: hypothetical protein IT561_27200 [Alphaproteobacteria bacterium]|nr:hypothetical protein [Alphaproteobacteria bacterium]
MPSSRIGPDESTFAGVRSAEWQRIRERRARNRGVPADQVDSPHADLVGLALSGGGIRSAAFCLGAIQALDSARRLRAMDYVSMVSGGGYTGAALVATMREKGEFVFRREHSSEGDVSDTPAVGHIRNYSRYLLPGGLTDMLHAVAVIARGLIVNVVVVLAILLLAAAITLLAGPSGDAPAPPGSSWLPWFDVLAVHVTLPMATLLTLGFCLYLVSWALWRSACEVMRKHTPASRFLRRLVPDRVVRRLPEFAEQRSWLARVAVGWLVLIVLVAVAELQPVIVRWMVGPGGVWLRRADGGGLTLENVGVLLAAFSGAVGFLSSRISAFLKSKQSDPTWNALFKRVLARALVIVAAAALPLALYLAYLAITVWGLTTSQGPTRHPWAPAWLSAVISPQHCAWAVLAAAPALWLAFSRSMKDFGYARAAFAVVGLLLVLTMGWVLYDPTHPATAARAAGWTYLGIGSALAALGWLYTENANSLHRLYRDRLSKAFLFEARTLARPGEEQRDDPHPLRSLRLSQLEGGCGPYPLINAALNIQGAQYLNRRGRNADFFVFTPLHVGSAATGYAGTEQVERADPALDLGTAMAISGAAVSSNMGKASVRPLSFTLALLNLRLGYWLPNPAWLRDGRGRGIVAAARLRSYIFAEAFGRLDERSAKVYLTDGGHIDNLGIYELLRRECLLIVAIDAEADASYGFPSFVEVQRYARIDLGVRIELPWQAIRDEALALTEVTGKGPIPAGRKNAGRHAAVGRIHYATGSIGYLLYVKSSITGDENDYVLDYRRRYPTFPHETTGDQFFSEEQFEVYRALGFHATSCALAGDVHVAADELGRKTAFRDAMAALPQDEQP